MAMILLLKKNFFFFLFFSSMFLLEGCTCCAYLNHMFNAERAYEEAGELREARLDSLGETESLPSGEELKKYEKVIEKGSKVLERFPNNKKRTAEAVFLIGESYRHKGEWSKAVEKYDEYERYFGDRDSMRTVEYQRAYCLYKNKEYNVSRFALEPVLQAGKAHPYYLQGLNLLSLLGEQEEDKSGAIAALEAILADTSGTPFLRGKAHFRLAALYFEALNYAKAREHYTAKEIEELVDRDIYTAKIQAAECLYHQKKYVEAAKEYFEIAKDVKNKDKLSFLFVRYGELLFLAEKYPDGFAVFRKVTSDYPKTEDASRAYYNEGVYEQKKAKNYEQALAFYDSSYNARPPSKWGKESKERAEALKNLLLLQSNNNAMDSVQRKDKPFFDNEFMIAELFLFKLSEVDSAIVRLDGIISDSDDSLKVLRATYARAFIYDEFVNDKEKAEELYTELIEKYPDSDYAKQAQINMGEPVTLKTKEDLAKERFMKAESLWLYANEIPLESMELVDSAYARALISYDSVYQEFKGTTAGTQALYMTAVLFAMSPDGLDSAAARLRMIREEAPTSPWGLRAASLLSGRVSITEEDIVRLKQRLELNEKRASELSDSYYKSFAPKKEEKATELKTKEDEILENTYNSMYDFE